MGGIKLQKKNLKVFMDIFRKSFPNIPFVLFVYKMKQFLDGYQSILDIGCGPNSPLSLLNFQYSVGLDADKLNIKKAKKNKTHDKYVLSDARKIRKIFPSKSFDSVAALDLIEHLPKKDGFCLIEDMEEIARKKVIIFTPNGFIAHPDHLSGWNVAEMRNSGYKVYGIYGLKFFRENNYGIRFRPKIFWGLISELTNCLYSYHHPEKAVALLCLKEL